jgi:cytoskeletal protein CcmA (bactofilin family)
MDATMSESSSTPSSLVVPRRAILEGSVDYPGKVVVEGTILGDIRCADIVITERGVVEGTICANTATVMGEASGSIYSNQVTLKTACSVTAEIFHKQLSLENGCYFEGKSRRVTNPLSLTSWDTPERSTSDELFR